MKSEIRVDFREILNTSLSLSLQFKATVNYTTILGVRQECHFSFIEHPVVKEFITSVEVRLVGNRSTGLLTQEVV